jgi:hypothetical protein
MGIKDVSCRFCCQLMQSRAQCLPGRRVSDWRCRQSTNSVQKDGKDGSNRGRKRVIIQGEVGQMPGKVHLCGTSTGATRCGFTLTVS